MRVYAIVFIMLFVAHPPAWGRDELMLELESAIHFDRQAIAPPARYLGLGGGDIKRLPLYPPATADQSLLVNALRFLRAGMPADINHYVRFDDAWGFILTTAGERQAILYAFLHELLLLRPAPSVVKRNLLEANFASLFPELTKHEVSTESLDAFNAHVFVSSFAAVEETKLAWQRRSLRQAVKGLVRVLWVRENLALHASATLRERMDELLDVALDHLLHDSDLRRHVFMHRRPAEDTILAEHQLLRHVARDLARALRVAPYEELRVALRRHFVRYPNGPRHEHQLWLAGQLAQRLALYADKCEGALQVQTAPAPGRVSGGAQPAVSGPFSASDAQ